MRIYFLGVICLSKLTTFILQIAYTLVILSKLIFFAKLLYFDFVLGDVLFSSAMQATKLLLPNFSASFP